MSRAARSTTTAWAFSLLSLVLLGAAAFGAGCATTSKEVAFEAPSEAGAALFADAASGADAGNDGAGQIPLLCAASGCPANRVTCPESLYPCQVDLSTDNENCGSCGHACPFGTQAGAQFTCVGGECVVACKDIGGVKVLDCNGYSGDGCEVATNVCDQAHCGSCAACPSGTDCVYGKQGPRCGCESGLFQCGTGCDAACTTEETDDKNCGACGNACNPAVGTPVGACKNPENTYFGCRDKTCGQLKCAPGFGDCNRDTNRCPTDGCETYLAFDDKNCGACGAACAPGGQCINGICNQPTVCKPTEVACSSGVCADLTLDSLNCGACGHICGDDGEVTCSRGVCVDTCPLGFGDCDGFAGNGCETDLLHDPEHCGGCANTCDLAAGQPCIDGLCLRGPCSPGQTK